MKRVKHNQCNGIGSYRSGGRLRYWGPLAAAAALIYTPQIWAIEYGDFPPDLQAILDDRMATLTAEGGVCIAGRVRFSDGSPINGGEDVQVNFVYGVDASVVIYPGGWFICIHVLNAFYAGPDRTVIHRAFRYDPLDASTDALDGEITYLDSLMQRTAAHELATIMGVVNDENGDPFPGARVGLNFPYSNLGSNNSPYWSVTTNALGQFQFADVAPAEYALTASKTGYAFHYDRVTPEPGSVAVQERRLYPNRRIVIRYAHQTDGTRTFSGEGVVTGLISWLNGAGGVDFSEGVVEDYEPNDLRDLEMRQTQDVLEFRNFYVNGRNGFYDAGAIDFDSLVEGASTGYTSSAKPVVVGHVYVVRTYVEDQYVKFLVESDESSFRSVILGDPDPIVFAGYGLTVDFGFTTGHGQLFVERTFLADDAVAERQLPYAWQLSGLSGISFSANYVFSYLDSDLIARRVVEDDIELWRSTNSGFSWHPVAAEVNADTNTISVSNQQSLGWFAVTSAYEVYFGDMDLDDDIDLADVAGLMNCYSGPIDAVSDPSCVPALIDDNASLSLADVASITACMDGPSILPVPACRK